jgi:hypothetical protein
MWRRVFALGQHGRLPQLIRLPPLSKSGHVKGRLPFVEWLSKSRGGKPVSLVFSATVIQVQVVS